MTEQSNTTSQFNRKINPTTNENDSISSEKEHVSMQDQQDWLTELENTVEKVIKLDLSNKNLEELPACLKRAENLKELDLSRNRLAAIPLELLRANKELEKLDISYNKGVAFLDEGSALEGLKCLKAECCGWKVIPANVGQFFQLEELHLYGNSLEIFDPDFFLNLPSLKVLDLGRNKYRSFGIQPWTSLKNLKSLSLDYVGLNKIPDSVKTLENLNSLDISYNYIERLDPEMFSKLGCLEELDIGDNEDLVIDDSIWEILKGLRSLIAEGIRMTEISPGLKKLTKLQKLYLGDNDIPVLNPADFAGFPDLEHLEFENYTPMPDVVTTGWDHLKSLKKLTINGSTLKVLDDWVGELQYLEELGLDWSLINTITDDFFVALSKLPNFRVLSLGLTSINTLPFSILLLKDKNVKIIVKCNLKTQMYNSNVSRQILRKEFGNNIVFND